MGRTSCIRHPENELILVIHEWQVRACDGNTCAAALLSFFEYWHNIKVEHRLKATEANDVAEQHGEARSQDETLWQFHTEEELEQGILIYRRSMIRTAIQLLEEKGFITLSGNPNPRFKFDRTRFFYFHADKVNEWLQSHYADESNSPSRKNNARSRNFTSSSLKNNGSSVENKSPSREIKGPSFENKGTIPETSYETSYENTHAHTPARPQIQVASESASEGVRVCGGSALEPVAGKIREISRPAALLQESEDGSTPSHVATSEGGSHVATCEGARSNVLARTLERAHTKITTETSTETNNHTHTAVEPPTAKRKRGADRAARGVCVRSAYSLEEWLHYAEHLQQTGKRIDNPEGLALKLYETGKGDALMKRFLTAPTLAPSTSEVVPADRNCQLCYGTGFEVVPGKGARRCQCRQRQPAATGGTPAVPPSNGQS